MTNRPGWPAPHDATGWARVVGAPHGMAGIPPGRAVAALRALDRTAHRRVLDALAGHVSEAIIRRLRRKISVRHPNRGEDMIERAHDRLFEKILDPTQPEGDDIATNFDERVHFRAMDAIREELLRAQRFLMCETGPDGEVRLPAGRQRVDAGAAVMPVGVLLARVADPRKRLAFRLHVEGMQVRHGRPCVAAVLGVDPKTAAKWIAQAKAILRDNIDGGE